MQGWITGFQESINFIEQNLTEEMDTEEIAARYGYDSPDSFGRHSNGSTA